MIWAVRHEWPSGAQFKFNCYQHWATLVVRDTGEGSGHFLHSKEGMNQRDPLSMIAYGIEVLPIIRELWNAHPLVTQPLYAGDAGAGGTFQQILEHFRDLQARGLARATFPGATTKMLLVGSWW